MRVILQARPRVARLGWPHTLGNVFGALREVLYSWVYVKPDGSGWTTIAADSVSFDERKLGDVIEQFYDGVGGNHPYDFRLFIVTVQSRSRSAPKKARQTKKTMTKSRKRSLTGVSRERARAPRRARRPATRSVAVPRPRGRPGT